ncbi:hypothetical protein MRX96_055244 [Rhipicephalus microplus]
MSERPTDFLEGTGSAPASRRPRRGSGFEQGSNSDVVGLGGIEPEPVVGMGRGYPDAGVRLLLLLRQRHQLRQSQPRALPTVCGRPVRHREDRAPQGQENNSPKDDDADGVGMLQPSPGLKRGLLGRHTCEPTIGIGRGNPQAGLPCQDGQPVIGNIHGNPQAGLRLQRFLRREQRCFG